LSDIFREVEEEVRRERLEKLWKQYGDFAIAGVAAIVIAVAGYQLWLRYEASQRAEASAEYNAAVQIASTDPVAAVGKFEELSKKAPSGYAKLAKFAEADTLLVTGERDKALAIYQSLGNGGNDLIGDAARLRAAWSVVDFAPRATIESLVAPLADPGSQWRFLAKEVLAYADYRSGDVGRAEQEYRSIADAQDATTTLRARAKGMAALIKSGGEKDFGTVPPLPQTTAAPASH
jgi:hypothetical protein